MTVVSGVPTCDNTNGDTFGTPRVRGGIAPTDNYKVAKAGGQVISFSLIIVRILLASAAFVRASI